MLGRKKKTEKKLNALDEFEHVMAMQKSLVEIEKALDKKYQSLEKALNEKYMSLDKTLHENLEEDKTELEKSMAEWCETEGGKAEDHRATQTRLQEHNYKHMTTVEDYVALQMKILNLNTEILSEVRDCLKVLALDKMKGGKRVLNDSN